MNLIMTGTYRILYHHVFITVIIFIPLIMKKMGCQMLMSEARFVTKRPRFRNHYESHNSLKSEKSAVYMKSTLGLVLELIIKYI
jgi:hypothetical protein